MCALSVHLTSWAPLYGAHCEIYLRVAQGGTERPRWALPLHKKWGAHLIILSPSFMEDKFNGFLKGIIFMRSIQQSKSNRLWVSNHPSSPHTHIIFEVHLGLPNSSVFYNVMSTLGIFMVLKKRKVSYICFLQIFFFLIWEPIHRQYLSNLQKSASMKHDEYSVFNYL